MTDIDGFFLSLMKVQNNEILTKQIAARPWVVLEVELGGGWGAAVGEFSRGIRRLATNAFRVIFSAFLPLLVLICPAVRQQCPILGAFPRCPVVEGSRRCWVSADATACPWWEKGLPPLLYPWKFSLCGTQFYFYVDLLVYTVHTCYYRWNAWS